MNQPGYERPRGWGDRGGLLELTVCVGVVLLFLFLRSFDTSQVLFNNDGPLGIQMARSLAAVPGFTGIWFDIYWLGNYLGSYSANVTRLLQALFDPRTFLGVYPPISALILGWCAWLFFRCLGFGRLAAVLGGVGAALNMNFFSNACWGLASRGLGLAMTFLALAALQSGTRRYGLLKTVLAGLAVGMAVSESGDNGALFSLFVAGYALFLSLTGEGSVLVRVSKGIGKSVLMAIFAGVLAAQTLSVFVDTAVKGVVGTEQGAMNKELKYDWATQWSLPKLETLRVIIPGLYGYRLNTPDGGGYWGKVGQQPGWEQHHQGFPRHSGAGEYAGVVVVLVGLWALVNSLSRTGRAFSPPERKAIWFWSALGLAALVLAWGRFAPFYRLLYELPYASTIRNPMKFMHPFHMVLMILFAYGLQGLSRLYLEKAGGTAMAVKERLSGWWSKASPFEKKWNYAMAGVLGLSVLGYLLYSASQGALAQYLSTQGFDLEGGRAIARFSAGEVGVYVLVLAASLAILLLVQCGLFAGSKAVWAEVALGVVLVLDLGRADAPWVVYEVIGEKYAMNPVLEVLKEKPWQHRVAAPNLQVPQQVAQWHNLLQQVYQVEWLQHHFTYYNVAGLEVSQMARMPEDYAAFNGALGRTPLRLWELTNTRYLLALAGFVDAFNQQLDPAKKRFHSVLNFDIKPRAGGGITAVVDTNGPFALIEFDGALPRAKLYTRWEVSTNDSATLKRLADPAFDPWGMVLVAEPIAASGTNAGPATVEYTSYEPKRIQLKTQAEAPGVLLLNDRWDRGWKVWVDGQRAEMLRCNYVMRGVQVPAGSHRVEFRFQPPVQLFYVSLGATVAGVLLCGLVAGLHWRRREAAGVKA